MKEKINAQIKSDLMKEINAARTAAGLEVIAEDAKRSVGTNGYTLGQSWTLKGTVSITTTEINGNKSVYIGLDTVEGQTLSLQRLMGISSLKGYKTEGTFENHYLDGSKDKFDEITAEVIDGFDFADAWQPEERDLYDMAAIIKAHPQEYANKKVTYLGIVVRPFKARTDSSANNFQKYKAGTQRAMSAPLFSLK